MKNNRRLAGILFLALSLAVGVEDARAVDPLSPPAQWLDAWSFPTNWVSELGYFPIAYTNLVNVTGGNGTCLLIDTTNGTPAYLLYKTIESDGTTNLTAPVGTVSFWFNPSWAGTNAGGTGPGEYGRFFEVGTYTTNASIGWLSLYLSSDGSTVYFSGQTNNGSQATYLSAPVTLTNNAWYNLVLTYSATNSSFYVNGNLVTNSASGVAYYPGPSVWTNGFSVGSSYSDGGIEEIHGELDDLTTYNYALDGNTVAGLFKLYTAIYYGASTEYASYLTNAPSGSTNFPTFSAVSGGTNLVNLGTNSTGCTTNNTVSIANVTATLATNQVVTVTFSIIGGSNNVLYDVFATPTQSPPSTNAQWAWEGQGYHCNTYSLTFQSNSVVYLILGQPGDPDADGLTTAYELLVSKTDPNKADSVGDGMLDGWRVMWKLTANQDNSAIPNLRANYTYDFSGRWWQLTGILAETLGFDHEGNITGDSQ